MLGYSHRSATSRPVNRRRVLQGSMGLLAGSAAFALACGGSKKEEAKAPAGGAPQGTTAPAASGGPQPKRGGVLLDMVATEVGVPNPVTNWGEGQWISGALVYDRLVNSRVGKDTAREYMPEAAGSVEFPDSTTLVFKLRPGLKFQNRAPVSGRAVTGDDVVKSQMYVKSNPAAQDSSFQNGSMQSVESPDAQTVVFKLKAPNAYVFSATQLTYPQSTAIIPKELLDNLDKAWSIGSGPYELTESEINSRYTFKRFDGYHGQGKSLPYIDERRMRLIIDPAAQEASFRSEQAHIWTNIPTPNLADTIKKDLGDKIVMDEYLSLSLFPFLMNATRAPFNDVRVREAVYRLMNRKQFLDLLDQGRGVNPPGVLAAGLTEYQLTPAQTEKYWKQDAMAARQLLNAAGVDLNRQYGILTLNRPKNNQGAEIFQTQAAPLGMKVHIRAPVPLNEWHDIMEKGDWELAYAAMPAYDTPQKVLRFQHSNSLSAYKYTGPRDPAIDSMIDKSEQTLDKNERIKLVKDIQIALLDKYTPFFLTHSFQAYIARWKYVKDYEVIASSHTSARTEMWLDK